VAKFVESDYEKVDRLLELREAAQSRLKSVEAQIAAERKVSQADWEEIDDEREDEWYLTRLDAGLSSLQAVDYVLAWVCMEDDGILAHTERMLDRKSGSRKNVAATLSGE
jgi:beta-catenin-like protein 1